MTLGCIGILLIIVGVSYAYWSLTFMQDQNNVVTTNCFEIEFLEGEKINLTKAHPKSDEEGLSSKPYTFIIKNVCDGSANYQINLETITHDGKKLPDQYLKINLMESNISKITSKLESSLNTEVTIDGAVNAYQLLVGELKPREEKEFSLRIWMHSEVTAENKDSMNAIYNGKISVITSYALTSLIDIVKLAPKVTEGEGLYEVDHSNANITYTTNETEINNLKQTELRYAGVNPNNYVEFNNELWRIIGLVNTPEGQRIKLIRYDGIGSYSWDTSASNVNYGGGVNEWSQADVMNLLNNGGYYNRTSGTCYNGQNNATVACDFSGFGLLEESKSMIDRVTWNIGSNGTTSYDNIDPNTFYNLERSNTIGKICSSGIGCNDTISRTTTWNGSVGLMYPSDYGYATSGGVTTDRNTCLSTVLSPWQIECKENNWLYKNKEEIWTMTPYAFSGGAGTAFRINGGGNIHTDNANYNYTIYPVVYLKLEIKVQNGNGSQNTPFELSI